MPKKKEIRIKKIPTQSQRTFAKNFGGERMNKGKNIPAFNPKLERPTPTLTKAP